MAAKTKARLTSFFALARKARLWQSIAKRGRVDRVKPLLASPTSRKTASAAALLLMAIALTSSGCQGSWEKLKGPGFSGWSGGMSEGVRGGSDNPETKPSGFFTDRRSEQIEQNLGGF